MAHPWLSLRGSDVCLQVLVVPAATRTRIMGVHDGRLKIQISAPPEHNQVGTALVRFLAQELRIVTAQIEVLTGSTSRNKTVRIAGVSMQQALWNLGLVL